jgi:ssDNA-specific exonuclease RecJ
MMNGISMDIWAVSILMLLEKLEDLNKSRYIITYLIKFQWMCQLLVVMILILLVLIFVCLDKPIETVFATANLRAQQTTQTHQAKKSNSLAFSRLMLSALSYLHFALKYIEHFC